MTDFESRQGEFRSWPRPCDQQWPIEFQCQLIDIIKDTVTFGFGAVLDLNAFRAYSESWAALLAQQGYPEEWQTQVPPNAYVMCVLGCLGAIGQRLKQLGHTDPVAYALDAVGPDKGKGHIQQMLADGFSDEPARETYMIGDVVWADSKQKKPLQGADLFVFEVAKEGRDTSDTRHSSTENQPGGSLTFHPGG